jgi:hypothetical protein
VPYTMDDFIQEYKEKALRILTPEKRLEGLSPEKRLEGLSPEERLEGLSPDKLAELQNLLTRQQTGPAPPEAQ